MVFRLIALWFFALKSPLFSAGFSTVRLGEIDDAIEQAITDARTPGGVFLLSGRARFMKKPMAHGPSFRESRR